MSSGRMTVILLVVTILLALAVPSLREALSERATQMRSTAQGMFPSPSEMAAIVAAAPEDARLHYAYALALSAETQSPGRLGPPQEPVTAEAVREAFGDAIALAPDDPAPRLSLAIFEIEQAQIERLPGEAPATGEPSGAPTDEQLERVRLVRAELDEVRALDPGNALPDYLQAWTSLAEDRPEQARAAATRGAGKGHWTSYQAKGAEALLRLIDHANLPDELKPMAAITLSVSQTHLLAARLRSMARALRDHADMLRRQGDHEAAIANYESLLRMGHLMRVDAHELIDGLLAVAISSAAVSSDDWAPPNEAQRLEADTNLTKTDLRLPRFAEYLREHGRPELAAFAETEIVTGRHWKTLGRQLPGRMTDELVQDISGGPMMNAMAVLIATAIMLGLAALIGLLSLFARYWREPRTRVGWSHLQWLGLLALLVVPGQIGGLAAARVVATRGMDASIVAIILPVAALIGAVAWIIAVLVLALRKRRLLAPEERLGGPRTVLRGLRAVVLPTLAALVLLCMPATLAIQHNLDAMAEKHRQLAVEGEVAYYGLQSDLEAVESRSSDADGG